VLRSQIIAAVRSFLDGRGFMEVETTILQPQAGGALARPFVTHHHTLDVELYLRIALELHLKRLVVGGFDRVYEIGRVFRNEGISVEHNPEFTLLECYQAYSDYQDIMTLVEEMFVCVAKEVLGNTRLTRSGQVMDFGLPWRRVYLREAIKDHCGIDFKEYPDAASLRTRMTELGMDADPAKGKGRLIMSFADQTSAFFDELTQIIDAQKQDKEKGMDMRRERPYSALLTEDEEPVDNMPSRYEEPDPTVITRQGV